MMKKNSIHLSSICSPVVIQTCYPAEAPGPFLLAYFLVSWSSTCADTQDYSVPAVGILLSLSSFLIKFGPLSTYTN